METNWQILFAPVVVALIPILVNYIKKLIPERLTWVIPMLAMVLGPIADFVSQKAFGVGVGPVTSVALGLAGIGLRELVSNLMKPAAPSLNP